MDIREIKNKNMNYRYTEETDYETLCKWWKFWRFPAPPKHALPNNMQDGIIVLHEGKEICAGFIYRTPSSIYFLEFIISNPEIKDRKIRKKALLFLIQSIGEICENNGAKAIFTFLKHKNLMQHYKDCGYIADPNSGFEMIKILDKTLNDSGTNSK